MVSPPEALELIFVTRTQVNSSKTWSGLVEGDSNPPVFLPELMQQVDSPIMRAEHELTELLVPAGCTPTVTSRSIHREAFPGGTVPRSPGGHVRHCRLKSALLCAFLWAEAYIELYLLAGNRER